MNNRSLITRLRHGLVPAVPIPFREDRSIHIDAFEHYIAYMQRQPVAGVAVWAHTGRGLHITAPQREVVLNGWRAGLPDGVIVAGVGGDHASSTDAEFLASAMKMGEAAASGGADAFLVYAPTRYRSLPSSELHERILSYHSTLGSLGVPLILFYLYEDAGGISYSHELLTELAQLPSVIGMKIATALNIIVYQDVLATFRSAAPEKLIVTGEDRFLGYSLMCGAEAALIGMGSAATGLQKAMMDAWFFESSGARRPEHPATIAFAGRSFLELSAAVDRFSFATFAEPLQGYIQRMLWVLVEEGVIPEAAAHDPWGPVLSAQDRARVRSCIRTLL